MRETMTFSVILSAAKDLIARSSNGCVAPAMRSFAALRTTGVE
jgi:hypothetical protein